MGYKLNEDMFNLTSIEGNENQNHDLSFHIHHVCMYLCMYTHTNICKWQYWGLYKKLFPQFEVGFFSCLADQ